MIRAALEMYANFLQLNLDGREWVALAKPCGIRISGVNKFLDIIFYHLWHLYRLDFIYLSRIYSSSGNVKESNTDSAICHAAGKTIFCI